MFGFLKKKLSGWLGKEKGEEASLNQETVQEETPAVPTVKTPSSKETEQNPLPEVEKVQVSKIIPKKASKQAKSIEKEEPPHLLEQSEKPVVSSQTTPATPLLDSEPEKKEVLNEPASQHSPSIVKKSSKKDKGLNRDTSILYGKTLPTLPKQMEDPSSEKKSWFSFGKRKKKEPSQESIDQPEKVQGTELEKASSEEQHLEHIEEHLEKIEVPSQEESPPLSEEPEESEGFFSKLIHKITTSTLTQDQFDELFLELELTLLENNVALEAVDAIKLNLSKSLVGQDIKKTDAEKKVFDALASSILSLLIDPPALLDQIKEKKGIFTILFFGINGTGKTTSIAKLAYLLKKNGISCVLAAADTFRAASIEQLKIHGERIGVEVISQQYGSDPAAVAFDARKYAEKNNIKVVLIDTAGRMYTRDNLLKEMDKIVRIAQPDLKIFVGESITGNDAVDQAKAFQDTIGIDGLILSKADIDEKAGTILSVSYVTGKPIYFLGVGQEYADLEAFSKKNVLKHLGLG